jgi:hypothetical protein
MSRITMLLLGQFDQLDLVGVTPRLAGVALGLDTITTLLCV